MARSVRGNELALAHWRRTTAEIYAQVRHAQDPILAWKQFTKTRDRMFKEHSQSPLPAAERAAFRGIFYYAYKPAFRVTGSLKYEMEPLGLELDLGHDGILNLHRVAAVHFELFGQAAQLSLYWVAGYGGGLLLPFRDLTNETETYGGGRYLYDTIKGADLGANEEELILDFNFAYNPSCAYDESWICPLAPQANSLKLSVTAGEKRFTN